MASVLKRFLGGFYRFHEFEKQKNNRNIVKKAIYTTYTFILIQIRLWKVYNNVCFSIASSLTKAIR